MLDPIARHIRQLLWAGKDTEAITLLISFIDEFGAEALTWAPETMLLELQETVIPEVPALAFDNLQAAITVLTTDKFVRDLPTFISVCNIFSGNTFDPEVFDPADVGEVAWGLTEAMMIEPTAPGDFSEEIQAYVAAIAADEGFTSLPDLLAIGRPYFTANIVDFSEDPDMQASVYTLSEARLQAITDFVAQRGSRVIAQLQALPLQNGSAQGLLRSMQSAPQ